MHGQAPLLYLWNDMYPGDSNSVITILEDVLFSQLPDIKRPPILYLQLDNCTRENKNRYLLAYCCLLVRCGLFKKVKMSFLPVGHTHEDVVICHLFCWHT